MGRFGAGKVIFLILILAMLAYAPTAVWMLDRGGLRKLWLTFGFALLSMTLAAVLVAKLFAVPNTVRLVLFVLGLGGATMFFTTVFLDFSHRLRWRGGARTLAAVAGCIAGVVTGVLLVVYGLRSW